MGLVPKCPMRLVTTMGLALKCPMGLPPTMELAPKCPVEPKMLYWDRTYTSDGARTYDGAHTYRSVGDHTYDVYCHYDIRFILANV